jgi:hypothetical protein
MITGLNGLPAVRSLGGIRLMTRRLSLLDTRHLLVSESSGWNRSDDIILLTPTYLNVYG